MRTARQGLNPSAVALLTLLILAPFVFAAPLSTTAVDCYQPIDGGWAIRLSADPSAPRPAAGSRIGVVEGNARAHRRPLFPPADKGMIWSPDELPKLQRCGFRPLVLAYNEPRFLFDFHSAGGLLGHLYLGLVSGSTSKWFHHWSELEVRYTEGRMEYTLRDASFLGVEVALAAAPLADAAGLIVKVVVTGLREPVSLVWGYGGVSAFFTNYAMDAPEFSFAPQQCAKDRIAWDGSGFVLRRGFDKSDVCVNEIFAAARYLTNWQAVVRGGSSWEAASGLGAANAFAQSPAALLQNTEWRSAADTAEKTNCVAVQKIALGAQPQEGFIVIGMGGQIAEDIRAPARAWQTALARNHVIAHRIVTRTPDPHLDAAMRLMAFATEGTWGDSAILHGGWSWRFAYLGWRGWYGSTCYGWTDRVKKSIRNHTTLGLVRSGPDAGGLGALLEYSPGIYYNMNEVFLDQVRHYFEYTDDLDLMREIFPVLTGILEWENRRLQPGSEGLYENSLNTWISDSHWYIQGQCTQASAYMLGAHRFLADLAKRLGKDPAPFQERANRIHAAMQEKLWLTRDGVFAEYRDTRGHRLLHAEPELPTIYHSAEFGAADPLQIYQMLHWADTHLRSETTPGRGKLWWSSNWFPNRGRSYTHSTYEMAYAEELNFALTDYLAGRADEAYAILRAALGGIFNGPTPGGLACHANIDGRQRANDEFTDAISLWGRTITEGLFGIAPKRPDGFVALTPQFPSDWNDAAIDTPHFSYRWRRAGGTVSIEWTSPVETSVRLRLPINAASVANVRVDGKRAARVVTPGFDGASWVQVQTPRRRQGTIKVQFTPRAIRAPEEVTVKQDDRWQARLANLRITDWKDPQQILTDARLANGGLRGIVSAAPGPALVLALAGQSPCQTWVPLRLRVEPSIAPVPPKIWSPPPAGARDLKRWTPLDLSPVFNEALTNVLPRVTKAAQAPPLPASQVGFGYWKDHLLQYHGSRNQEISDAAWRKKVGADNLAWTTDGIPFKTAATGPNIAVVTQAGGFPAKLEFPVNVAGRTLYLMISGMTFPVQSHVVNLRVTLRYADGASQEVDLVNPFTIGDGWSTWCGRFHDPAANGFENLGGRSGPAGSAAVADLTKPVAVDTEAHLVALELRPGTELRSLGWEAIANDCIFGVMGATLLK